MPRGVAGGAAAFALTAALASDNGGFDATTWNLALIALCAAALVVVVVDGGSLPRMHAVVFLGSLAALTAWNALSYFWSDSPPFAPVEAQRVALYFAAALTVVLARHRLEPRWVAGGIAAGATFVAIWNIVVHIRGVANPQDVGAVDVPVGYANSLALLCVLGMVLLGALPRPVLVALPVLVADLVLQKSTGAYEALIVAGLVYGFVRFRRARPFLVVAMLACVVAVPFVLRGHERTAYWRVAVREAEANPVAGSGAGTFADWWLRERSDRSATKEAHALYLETLAELGPIGLALLLTALAVPIAAGLRGPHPVLGTAVATYAVGAAADFHWELAGVTVPTVVLAALVVSTPSLRRSRSFVPLLVLLPAAGILAYAGNARLASARSALQQGDRARAAATARSALRFAPYSADAWEVIGDAGGGTAAYRRGLALDPNDWVLWSKLAAASTGKSHRLALREAVRLNPKGSSEP
jgi:O-antigen ligase/polysaccharide polymerase Wzy-like membrane protein